MYLQGLKSKHIIFAGTSTTTPSFSPLLLLLLYHYHHHHHPLLSKIIENGEIFKAWAKDVSECEEHFKVRVKTGLSIDEVENRRKIYGWNELEKHEGQSIWSLVLEQFNDTLVRILLGAAIISFVLAWYDGEEGGEMEITTFVEPLVIFLILIVNAIVRRAMRRRHLRLLRRFNRSTPL